MTAEQMDDHLPPPAPAGKPVREKRARAREAAGASHVALGRPGAVPRRGPAGRVLGRVSVPGQEPVGESRRLPWPIRMRASPGVGPGATRDLPGSGGGQPSLAADPVARQRLLDLEAAVAKEPKNADLLVQLGNTAYDVEDWKQGGRRVRAGSQAARRRSERPHRSRSRVPEHRQRRQGARDVREGARHGSERTGRRGSTSGDRLRHRPGRHDKGARDPQRSSRRSIPRSRRSTASERRSSSGRKGARGRDRRRRATSSTTSVRLKPGPPPRQPTA